MCAAVQLVRQSTRWTCMPEGEGKPLARSSSARPFVALGVRGLSSHSALSLQPRATGAGDTDDPVLQVAASGTGSTLPSWNRQADSFLPTSAAFCDTWNKEQGATAFFNQVVISSGLFKRRARGTAGSLCTWVWVLLRLVTELSMTGTSKVYYDANSCRHGC